MSSPTATASMTASAIFTPTPASSNTPTPTATHTPTLIPSATASRTHIPLTATATPTPAPTSTPAEIVLSSFGVDVYPIEGKCSVGLLVKISGPAPVVSVEAEWAAFDEQGNTMASGKQEMGGQGDGVTWFVAAHVLAHFPPASRIEWSVTATNTLMQSKKETAPTFFFGEGC